jgi:hypothetical protein
MARVLGREYDSIRLEPPGPEGEGIEFCLKRGTAREYHQVKRQGARHRHWTLRELGGVLTSFRARLADPSACCVFVSGQDAGELHELAERARDAADQPEFEREFAKGEWGSRLSLLMTLWPGCTPSEAFSLLRRIHVPKMDEKTLRRLATLELAQVVEGDAATASDVLFAFAFDSVHRELDRTRISEHLSSRGFSRPIWADGQRLSDVVRRATNRYVACLQQELIRGELIQRPECADVLAALRQDSAKRGAVVTGCAGSGKSGVLLQAIKTLREQGVHVLAFRLDRLDATQRPDEVGRQLGLPASPVTTLAALAKREPSVLILDQLDAVSIMSGRNAWFFECFDEIIQEALTRPEMRLVFACRQFDFENDDRLRRLGHNDLFTRIQIGELSVEVVREVVDKLAIDPSRLSAEQLRLLSVPAHLKLLCEVAHGSGTSLDFKTPNELYARYWSRKEQLLRMRPGRAIEWSPVIDRLCEYMSQRQVLSAPATILDDVDAARDALLSEHVLVKDGERLSFFHEGFFDYAFARRFAAKRADLVDMLRSGEQELFRRAQVRQILLHERDVDRRSFLADITRLLPSPSIRFHIKHVIWALLRELPDPTEEEWRALERLLEERSYPHRREIWLTVGTLPWFKLLDSLGVVSAWLHGPDAEYVDNAVRILAGIQRDAPDRVAELMEAHLGESEEWRNRRRYLIQWADVGAGRRFFDFFLHLLQNGDLDGMGHFHRDDFLSFLYKLVQTRPDWGAQAVGRYLNRRLETTLKAGGDNPFTDASGGLRSQVSDRVLIGAAQGAPRVFIKEVLPFVLRAIELTAVRAGDPPWADRIWRSRHPDPGHSVDSHLLWAMAEALENFAREAPDELRRVATPLRASQYETVQFLLLWAYRAGGAALADDAIEYLTESPGRLCSGYLEDRDGASRDLIAVASRFCSNEQLSRLQGMLLSYNPKHDERRWRGWTQFGLLLAIDSHRRSDAVLARIEEWKRKFGREPQFDRSIPQMSWVQSPIPPSALEKMSDNALLHAMACYADDRERQRRDGKLVGGAQELSSELESQASKSPLRFARLALRMPDDTNAVYFDAILRGLIVQVPEASALFDACRRCHRLPHQPTGSALCRLVEKHADLAWPSDLLDAVASYATLAPDPEREIWRTEAPSGQCYHGGDPYTAGINSVRGSAAEAIRELIRTQPARLARFLPTIRSMVRDPSLAVRSCVASTLFPVLNQDRDLAFALFIELCGADEALLKTHYVEKLMHYATCTHFSALRPIVERMLASSDPEVAQAGARQACLAAFTVQEAEELAQRCAAGPQPLRLGAAQVYAANLPDSRWRSICAAVLPLLFNDASDEVRNVAAGCFDRLDGNSLADVPELVEQFERSDAFAHHHGQLLRALKDTTARLPHATIAVCERVADLLGEGGDPPRPGALLDVHALRDLLVRAYHQADDPANRVRCLDLIDRLLELRVEGAADALREFER